MKLTDALLEQVVRSLQDAGQSGPSVERRRELRTLVAGRATIVPCSARAGRKPVAVGIRDVSPSGIGIVHSAPLLRGEQFILLVKLGSEGPAQGLVCTVVNSRPLPGGGFAVGATYSGMVQTTTATKCSAPPETVAQAPQLPVEQLLSEFRRNAEAVLRPEEVQVLRQIEKRLSEARAQPANEPFGPAKQPVSPAPQRPSAPGANRGKSTEMVQLLTREACIRRAENALQARTLSGVVAQVIMLASSPRGDLSELATLVTRDPILSARILQAANSVSYISTRGVVSTIPDAIRNIGCAAVRDIAGAMGVFDAMPQTASDGFNPIRCWQHSFAVATLCQRLSTEAQSGAAYLVGLCHDLGEILFHSHFGPEYQKVLEVQQAVGKRRDEVERAMMGMTHGELVLTILRCLGLPEAIRAPIEAFHSAPAGRLLADPLARLLKVADLYANGLLLASSANSPVSPLNRSECRQATGQEKPPRPDGVSLRGEVYGLAAMLARLSPKDEAKLLESPYPRSRAKIWLAREPSLSPFDPVEAALELLGEVTVSDSLPSLDELSGYDGLVVACRGTSAAGFTAADIQSRLGAFAERQKHMLWLVGRVDENSATAAGVVPEVWPVPLSRLAEFVAALSARDQVPVSAAT